MPPPDRSKMAAGFSALLGAAPDASPAPPADPKPPDRPGEAPGRAGSGGARDEGTHARTTTGYRRESGDQVYRVSLFLTKKERRALRNMAEDAEMSLTDFVKAKVGL